MRTNIVLPFFCGLISLPSLCVIVMVENDKIITYTDTETHISCTFFKSTGEFEAHPDPVLNCKITANGFLEVSDDEYLENPHNIYKNFAMRFEEQKKKAALVKK